MTANSFSGIRATPHRTPAGAHGVRSAIRNRRRSEGER